MLTIIVYVLPALHRRPIDFTSFCLDVEEYWICAVSALPLQRGFLSRHHEYTAGPKCYKVFCLTSI